MRVGSLVFLAAVVTALGCASAYEKTYNEELGRLTSQERERQAAAMEAAHIEALKYVAVVYFKVGSSMIPEAGYRELSWFVEKIGSYPEAIVDVKGYADTTGTEQTNQNLSEDRAKNVADFLAQQGIAYDHINPAGYSSNFPDEPNDTAKGRSRNRRAEVRIR